MEERDIEISYGTEEYISNPENFCEICDCKMRSDKSVKLECGHRFHYECILESLKCGNNRMLNMQCPYCRHHIEFLPLLDGYRPIRNIHKEYNLFKISKFNHKLNEQVTISHGKYTGHHGIIQKINPRTVNILINGLSVRISKNMIN